jgi:hypothetical protein
MRVYTKENVTIVTIPPELVLMRASSTVFCRASYLAKRDLGGMVVSGFGFRYVRNSKRALLSCTLVLLDHEKCCAGRLDTQANQCIETGGRNED